MIATTVYQRDEQTLGRIEEELHALLGKYDLGVVTCTCCGVPKSVDPQVYNMVFAPVQGILTKIGKVREQLRVLAQSPDRG